MGVSQRWPQIVWTYHQLNCYNYISKLALDNQRIKVTLTSVVINMLNNTQSLNSRTEDLTDEFLAAEISQQPEYLSVIISRYQAPLARYIFRLSGLGREDVEDLLQTIFLKMYLNINNFDHTLKLSTWLYRIAHNETISHYRRRRSRPVIDYSVDEQTIDSLMDNDWQIAANRVIWRTQLNQALDRLPLKYRQAIVLRYFEDLDYQAIADIIQQPIGTVATLLSRGKRKLQQILTTHYDQTS